jgi:hypothetical protein
MDSVTTSQLVSALSSLAAVILTSWGSVFAILVIDRRLRRASERRSEAQEEEAIRSSTGILGYALGAILLGPLVLPLYFAVTRRSRIIGFAIGLVLVVPCCLLTGAVFAGSAAIFQRAYGVPLW